MTSSKQQRGKATRADIMNAARRLFSEHGYHKTGIADIQVATGLTKGAFYHHFHTKEELALAVLEAAQIDYAKRLFEPAMKGKSPGQRLAALLDGVVNLNRRPEWCNCRLMVTLSAELTMNDQRLADAVRDVQNAFLERLRSAVDEAQRSSEADGAVGANVWAQWIMNTLCGSVIARKNGSARVDGDQLMTVMKELLIIKKPMTGKPAAIPEETRK